VAARKTEGWKGIPENEEKWGLGKRGCQRKKRSKVELGCSLVYDVPQREVDRLLARGKLKVL